DESGEVVGVLSKTDLVDPDHAGSSWDGERGTVGDAMTPFVIALDAGDPAINAVKLMVADGLHRVLVLDRGKAVGVVTPMDILKALAGGANFEVAPSSVGSGKGPLPG